MVSPYLYSLILLMLGLVYFETINALDVDGGNSQVKCIEMEKRALVELKRGLVDPSNRLSSWVDGQDCCRWRGVKCNNRTGRVTKLNLHNPYQLDDDHGHFHPKYGKSCLGGNISHSLIDLQKLTYLDLSFNNFHIFIPQFFGSLTELRYLNLSNACFRGRIPNQIGNLSKLQHLDFNSLYTSPWSIYVDDIDWLSHLSPLRYVDMSGIDFSYSVDWLPKITSLSSVMELHLQDCGLSMTSPPIIRANLTYLKILDLSSNHLNCRILDVLGNMTSLLHLDLSKNDLGCSIPAVVGKMSSLAHLDLSENRLRDPIPDFLGTITSLTFLDLSNNTLEGPIPHSLGNATSITFLSLSSNRLDGGISKPFRKLRNLKTLTLGSNGLSGEISSDYWCGHTTNTLEILDLSGNKFTGNLPSDLGVLSSLKYLSLQKNHFTGTLPTSIGQLSNLIVLDVSDNVLEGTISDTHLLNLSRLQKLDISSNSFVVSGHFDQILPTQLQELRMGSIHLGPQFPAWPQSLTNLSYLDISHSGIVGAIPDWFWNFSSRMEFIDLSFNVISDPNLSSAFLHKIGIDLSSNFITGPIPHISPNIVSLILSKNSLSVPISDILCNAVGSDYSLEYLDLSRNNLSGSIPDCWMYFKSLSVLKLSDNSFSGQLPMSLKKCRQLCMLDVGNNKLSGHIPTWIGESLPGLMLLHLGSNLFDGYIPSELCQLQRLQYLDISLNNISGIIPRCFGSFSAMAKSVYSFSIYERMGKFKNVLLINGIDLSSNYLHGDIAREMMSLSGLTILNLSNNHLSGTIPKNIGQLIELECLDLSNNQFSGVIPEGLVSLAFLSMLNLSYNMLSGTIPEGQQLQTFDMSTYLGNPELCGPPISNQCIASETIEPDLDEEDDGVHIPWFYVGVAVGFIVGFWGVCGSLLLNHSWRKFYFRCVDEVKDRVYVVIAVNARKLQSKLQSLKVIQ